MKRPRKTEKYTSFRSMKRIVLKILLICGISLLFICLFKPTAQSSFDLQATKHSSNDTGIFLIPSISYFPFFKFMEKQFLRVYQDVPLIEKYHSYKKILVWYYDFPDKSLGFGFGHQPFKHAECEESRCFLTADRNQNAIEAYDAIIFHFTGLDEYHLPKKRSEQQRWIFFETEPAAYLFNHPRKFDNIFNWTMTYRKDSDIIRSYGAFIPKKAYCKSDVCDPTPTPEDMNYAEGKTKLVAWFVSRCVSLSQREKLTEELQKYVPVDIYGACGSLSCARLHQLECNNKLRQDYKFYLSFENSLCEDYITEKFFMPFNYNVVPIAYGGGDYKSVAPPHSYIDVKDFENVESLANYLKYLNENDTAYNEYFEWKSKYRLLTDEENANDSFCSLCKKLHLDKKAKIYKNLTKWFVGLSNCKRLLPYGWLDHLYNFFI